MTIDEALLNALEFLESIGYGAGDIHDDLETARGRILDYFPDVAEEEL